MKKKGTKRRVAQSNKETKKQKKKKNKQKRKKQKKRNQKKEIKKKRNQKRKKSKKKSKKSQKMINIFKSNWHLTFAVLLFVFVYGILAFWLRPSCFFLQNNQGLREFGVGSQTRTILPLWLASLIIGVLCYIVGLYVMLLVS